MSSDYAKIVFQWLEYATQDLKAAQEIAAGDSLHPRIACFLAQQSVENMLLRINSESILTANSRNN